MNMSAKAITFLFLFLTFVAIGIATKDSSNQNKNHQTRHKDHVPCPNCYISLDLSISKCSKFKGQNRLDCLSFMVMELEEKMEKQNKRYQALLIDLYNESYLNINALFWMTLLFVLFLFLVVTLRRLFQVCSSKS
eukprot:TRINITY_DN7506_c0_g1_i1.p1 TRINITY_DN7506_c0_g1~~TRINITY_DN7506_c0_g1_i1.p1  ORF type:complete len:149 (+),score=12.43 TRINITY_DN7506_c0_g1_i1:45-449(+)